MKKYFCIYIVLIFLSCENKKEGIREPNLDTVREADTIKLVPEVAEPEDVTKVKAVDSVKKF